VRRRVSEKRMREIKRMRSEERRKRGRIHERQRRPSKIIFLERGHSREKDMSEEGSSRGDLPRSIEA